MNRIWHLARNDLRLTLRDRTSFIWMLIMPLGMMWIFGNAFGGPSGPAKISLAVVDHDGGWLARAVVEELADEAVDLREMTPEEFATAEDKVRSLVIPEGFTAGVLAGEQQILRLEKEAESSQQFGLAGQMHVVRAAARTLGHLVEMETPEDAETAAEAFRRLAERPPLVELEVQVAGVGRPVPSGFGQSVPGILTMVVLMMTLIYGAVFLVTEKATGMLRRQAGAPVSRRQIYLGKLLGRMLIAGLQLVVLGISAPLLFDFSWGASWAGVLLLMLSFSLAVAGLACLLGAVLSTPEQASSVGWILSLVLAGLGGCWWPSEVMPGWLWTAAHVLPTAWAIEGFHSLITWGHGSGAALLPSAVLAGFGAGFAWLGMRLLRYD